MPGNHGVVASPAGYISPESTPKMDLDGTLLGHVAKDWPELPFVNRDYKRVDYFIKELHQAEKSGAWPQFMISLGENHTEGLPGTAYSPVAHVASNDLGLAKLIEAVSRSKFWAETAIFVIEDDAQNGPDHVDAHRTVGLVISPWVKRKTLDSTMYTTASMVRMMELILGLPPMTQSGSLVNELYIGVAS